MGMLVPMLVRVVVPMVVRMIMLVGRLDGAGSRLLLGGFGGRFGGLLGLLFSDCQWVAFRVLSMGNCKLLV
jgi:hypothetical protein